MNQPIRVLFADSSAVVRRLLQQILAQHPGIGVALAAKDGTEAIREFTRKQPDVVVLDVEMPGLNGLEVAKAIHALDPELPIIMFSNLTTRYASTTLNALSNGACDYETKPQMVGHLGKVQQQITDTLLPKILTWGQKRRQSTNGTPLPAATPTGHSPPKKEAWIPELLAIGASTGGPDSLNDFLASFPASFPLPIVIVQHMPPVFTRILAERLDAASHLEVLEATEGLALQPGRVILAPGDYHMRVKKIGSQMVVKLDQEEMVNFCRPSVDKLLSSVHEHYGQNCLTVMMTGMGKDGLMGCRLLHQAGGIILAQDKESSVVWGMPGSVVEAGLASYIGPPESLARHVVRYAASPAQLALG